VKQSMLIFSFLDQFNDLLNRIKNETQFLQLNKGKQL